MKKLYARVVLWLIRPALELREGADRAVVTQRIHIAAREAVTAVREAINRRG